MAANDRHSLARKLGVGNNYDLLDSMPWPTMTVNQRAQAALTAQVR